ncbi:hypothetical protein QZM44_11940 [Burkholderia seminalis]|nr:hypothetical protein [Burkholderia seminalis]
MPYLPDSAGSDAVSRFTHQPARGVAARAFSVEPRAQPRVGRDEHGAVHDRNDGENGRDEKSGKDHGVPGWPDALTTPA